MSLVRFALEWLTDGKDKIVTKDKAASPGDRAPAAKVGEEQKEEKR
ncbi:MAG: hypothetical protein N3A38_15795 [Planctomycetota bacterium]|nr:hypothetical protein [Planctomycetota bacterium]